MEKPRLSTEQILDLVTDYCAKTGIPIPTDLETDFRENFEGLEIKSYRQIKLGLCEKLKKIFTENEDLADKYYELVNQISESVRLKIALILGFEDDVAKKGESGVSDREFLIAFLEQLEGTQEWNLKMLQKWRYKGETGRNLYLRIWTRAGWSEKAIEIILGDAAGRLLEKHPYEKKEKDIKTERDARKYLAEFIKSLPEGATCSPVNLNAWLSKDGIKGNTLYIWILKHKGEFTEKVVIDLLGEGANDLLKNHPFEKTEHNVNSVAATRKYFLEFFKTLEKGACWSMVTLYYWVSEEDVKGKQVYDWILRHYDKFDEDSIRKILGENADGLLKENPFKQQEIPIKSKGDARKCLVAFLRSLKKGEVWSPRDLQLWIGAGDITGLQIYCYIASRNGDQLTENAVRDTLGECADQLLIDNPFKRQERNINNLNDVRKYFLQFLASLKDGEKWSITTLLNWETDETKGFNIYLWITRNLSDEFDKDALKLIFKEDTNKILTRNPFEKHMRKINSIEDAKRYFREFIEDLAEGKSWSVTQLIKWRSKDGCAGVNLYYWMLQRTRNEKPGFTEETIAITLGKDIAELLANHPLERGKRLVDFIVIVKKNLEDFLNSLPEGKIWTPITLKRWISEDGLVIGANLYEWIRKYIRNKEEEEEDDQVDWFYVLLNMIPLNLFKKHPFKHRLQGHLRCEFKENRTRTPYTTSVKKQEYIPEAACFADLYASSPTNAENLVSAKEGVENLIRGRQYIQEIYQYLDVEEWELLNRFYDGDDIEDDELYYLLGRVREVMLEHKPHLIQDHFS